MTLATNSRRKPSASVSQTPTGAASRCPMRRAPRAQAPGHARRRIDARRRRAQLINTSTITYYHVPQCWPDALIFAAFLLAASGGEPGGRTGGPSA